MDSNTLAADVCIAINIICGMCGLGVGIYMYMQGSIGIALLGSIVSSTMVAGSLITHEIMADLKQFKSLYSECNMNSGHDTVR